MSWSNALFLTALLVLAAWIGYWIQQSNRDMEEFWQTKIAELIGVKVSIEKAQLIDNVYTFSNVSTVDDEQFGEKTFLTIPVIQVSPGLSRNHWLVHLEQPMINYYHSGKKSNFSILFQKLKTIDSNLETFIQNSSLVIQLRVNDPEMLLLYSRETGKPSILNSIYQSSNQYPFDIEYATLNNPISSFKLKKMRGNEQQVARKTALYLFAAIEKAGKKRLDELQSSYQKIITRSQRNSSVDEPRPSLQPKVQKKKRQKTYKPSTVY